MLGIPVTAKAITMPINNSGGSLGEGFRRMLDIILKHHILKGLLLPVSDVAQLMQPQKGQRRSPVLP
jgi:hypothetical protein